MLIMFNVNGQVKKVDVPLNKRLLDVIREDLHLKGTKEGCASGDCGACTVILNGKLVTSCLVLVAHLDFKNTNTLITVEHSDSLMQNIKESFVKAGGTQCGFCTPGFIVSTYNLLSNNSSANINDIKNGIAGNLCRCTGYTKILDSIKLAQQLREA